MNDTPKRWLIEFNHQRHIEEGYGDALEAAKAWALRTLSRPDCIRVSEILPGHEVYVNLAARAEYK